MVSLLLELGATRDLANERGQTPMGYAKFLGMHAVIAVLEPDEGARKQAAIRAQRAAGDAAAKAEQEQRREQELQARSPPWRAPPWRAPPWRSSPWRALPMAQLPMAQPPMARTPWETRGRREPSSTRIFYVALLTTTST